MVVILQPNIDEQSEAYHVTVDYLNRLPGIEVRKHEVVGQQQKLTEIYLLGNTKALTLEQIQALPGVDRVIRISQEYRILGKHKDENRAVGFTYNGVEFNQDNLHIFAGLCAVDNPKNVEAMMKGCRDNNLSCTRMGAYKPRTSPYAFQGHGAACLPWVFELAGKYDIKVVAMEVTHERHVDEINEALQKTGNPTGVMLQIGTRNTQNFELLKAVGSQTEHPILLKRGFGITLSESLNAAEYLASEGNANVIFCLRGMKGNFGDPHRNLVDFAHVPVVKRLTRMPVCVDPSHSVGSREKSNDGISDILHASAQGVISGANMILIDFQPTPSEALVDGPQALVVPELSKFVDDTLAVREAYEKRIKIWNS